VPVTKIILLNSFTLLATEQIGACRFYKFCGAQRSSCYKGKVKFNFKALDHDSRRLG